MAKTNARTDKALIEAYKRKLELLRTVPGFDPSETPAGKRARIEHALANPIRFAETYLPHYCTSTSAPFHGRFANRVLRDKQIRIVQRWARAHAKSVWSDVIIPLWLWARGEPMYLVIIGSSFDRAKVLLSDVQAEFEANSRLIADFGDQQMNGTWEDGRFITKGGFIGQALGMGQSVRGLRHRHLRPTMIVVDDCETRELVKNEKRQWEMVRWIEQDVLGTMDGKCQRLIIANNRFASEMIQTKLLERHPSWHCDEVKAYDKVTYAPAWPSKYTAQYWRDLERENGTLATYAEFLNEPHVEGTIFTDDLFNVAAPPRIDHFVKLVGHWDVAYSGTKTSDYNAVRVWGLDKEGKFWLLACFVKQSKMRAAVDWMIQYDQQLPAGVMVHWQYESQFWNAELERTISDANEAVGYDLRIKKAEMNKAAKYDRILSMHGYYQNGRVWFSEKLTAYADHQVGLAQLRGIEPGYNGHDDAPDADERAISQLSLEHRTRKYQPTILGNRPAPKRSY